jgi:hypothetical protein
MARNYLNNEFIKVARGFVQGAYSVNKFGYNPAIPTNAFETVWDGSNLYTYISTASTATVTSSNTAADNGGTVKVSGLDANYNLVDEVLTIGGAAGSINFYRVFRVELLSSTTADTNVGTLTVTVDSIAAAIVSPERGQTLMALYTIPAGKKGYIVQLDIASSASGEIDVTLLTRNGSSNVWATKEFLTIRGGFNEKNFILPLEVNEKTDIEVRAKSSATAAISSGFEMIVIDVPVVAPSIY